VIENQRQLIQVALERAERQLAAQQAFAVASDQRGLVLAGIGVAAAAFVSSIEVNADQVPYIAISVIGFFMSAILACFSARPQKMFSGGAKYTDMLSIINEDKPLLNVLAGLGESADRQIEDNEKFRVWPIRYYKISIYAFAFSALTALVQPVLEVTKWATGSTP